MSDLTRGGEAMRGAPTAHGPSVAQMACLIAVAPALGLLPLGLSREEPSC